MTQMCKMLEASLEGKTAFNIVYSCNCRKLHTVMSGLPFPRAMPIVTSFDPTYIFLHSGWFCAQRILAIAHSGWFCAQRFGYLFLLLVLLCCDFMYISCSGSEVHTTKCGARRWLLCGITNASFVVTRCFDLAKSRI